MCSNELQHNAIGLQHKQAYVSDVSKRIKVHTKLNYISIFNIHAHNGPARWPYWCPSCTYIRHTGTSAVVIYCHSRHNSGLTAETVSVSYRLQSDDLFRRLCKAEDNFRTSDDFCNDPSELRELDDEWTVFCACISATQHTHFSNSISDTISYNVK